MLDDECRHPPQGRCADPREGLVHRFGAAGRGADEQDAGRRTDAGAGPQDHPGRQAFGAGAAGTGVGAATEAVAGRDGSAAPRAGRPEDADALDEVGRKGIGGGDAAVALRHGDVVHGPEARHFSEMSALRSVRVDIMTTWSDGLAASIFGSASVPSSSGMSMSREHDVRVVAGSASRRRFRPFEAVPTSWKPASVIQRGERRAPPPRSSAIRTLTGGPRGGGGRARGGHGGTG